MSWRRLQRGFTLVELIVVIVISGIIASMIASFITRPIEGAVQQDARAELVDAADTALRRMGREVRLSLPNSVRTDAPNRLEFIRVVEGASYRRRPGQGPDGNMHAGADHRLNTNTADDSFDLLWRFLDDDIDGGSFPGGYRIAVYTTNPNEVYGDAASGGSEGVITPAQSGGFSIDVSAPVSPDVHRIELSSAFEFTYDSPRQRLYVTESPVSFVCHGGDLLMFTDYAIQSSQPDHADLTTTLGATETLLARNVQSCNFEYAPGTAERAALVSLRLQLQSDDGGVVNLLHQSHVPNTP